MWDSLLNTLPLRLSGNQWKFALRFYGKKFVFTLKFLLGLDCYTIFMKKLRDILENHFLKKKYTERLFYDFISYYF